MPSLLEGKTSMMAPKQSRQKKRVVIELLLSKSKGETTQNIRRKLKQVYGDGVIDRLQHSDEVGEANQ